MPRRWPSATRRPPSNDSRAPAKKGRPKLKMGTASRPSATLWPRSSTRSRQRPQGELTRRRLRDRLEAEQATLQKVPTLAKKWGLNESRIFVGSVPVGVICPKGGGTSGHPGSGHSVEMASKFYKFMIELKKIPQAAKGDQTRAHLLALEDGINFPRGGKYLRIHGLGYRKGQQISVHKSQGARPSLRGPLILGLTAASASLPEQDSCIDLADLMRQPPTGMPFACSMTARDSMAIRRLVASSMASAYVATLLTTTAA